VTTLSMAAFTLVWTYSVEEIDWQEDWRIMPHGLELVRARVKGSGAGMEPPPDARPVDGWFQWSPARADAGKSCWEIPGPPGNAGCAMMGVAGRCRISLDTQSAPTSRRCAAANNKTIID
jgi:Domain of unknown function (DUF1850)